MKNSDFLWKAALCWFILINRSDVGIEGRRYDKCVTQDGRQGVCVIKMYCREASAQNLLPCYDDDDNHCCPIPTTQRSAQQPNYGTTSPPLTNPPTRRPGDDGRSGSPSDRPIYSVDRPRKPVIGFDGPVRGPPVSAQDDRQYGRPSYVPKQDSPSWSNDRPSKGAENNRSRGASPGIYEERKPDYPQEPSRGVYPSGGSRGKAGERGRGSNSPKDNDYSNETRRKPETEVSIHYPSRVPSHRSTVSPRRTTPSWNPSYDDPKPPTKFPGPYVPRPKVPDCGVKPYDLFIAGGEESEPHEWPWMAAIFKRHQNSRPKTFLCGGSLINTKYILTAAHCFVNNYVILPASAFVVRLGSHYLNSGEEYTVSNLIIHNNHSGSDFFNDIALVQLAGEVYVTDKIAPICLPFPEMINENLVGKIATVAGWGDTAFRSGGSRALQHVSVPIVSSEECFAAYSRVRGAAFLARGSDHVVCAGLREGGKDACLGDSGGPLMMKISEDRWVIFGIVSLGYKCAEPGYPGVYTRVTHYMSWIEKSMRLY